jgi:hypothetical protein
MTRAGGGASDVDDAITSLTVEQLTVLQAIYDYFREHATWPKFIAIDRPLRRDRKWDTAAIVQSLPESVIVPPGQGLRPAADDELRLRLLGSEACAGGSEDTARFVRLLRWLAEREETYEPPPGSDDAMPKVTSDEIARHLGLTENSDRLALARLWVMLRLDHWSTSTGSDGDGWYVRPGEDIWRFRDVQDVQDIVAAREAWIADGKPAVLESDSGAPSTFYYHVQLLTTLPEAEEVDRYNLSAGVLETQILEPYREGRAIMSRGTAIPSQDINRIQIIEADRTFSDIRRRPHSLLGKLLDEASGEWGMVVRYGRDVTDEFITEAHGQRTAEAVDPVVVSVLPPAPKLYINQQVIDAIRAKDGTGRFNVAKLLDLIDELNDNYARGNTYASHALLRGLLDHIPPVFDYKSFDEVASNYHWPQTDKKYMKQLAAFRAQGDDALHRPISADADLLGIDDMPMGVRVDRLLLECAKQL